MRCDIVWPGRLTCCVVLQKAPKAALPSMNTAQNLQGDGAKESSKDGVTEAQSLAPAAKPFSDNNRSPSSNDGEEEEIVRIDEEFCTPLLRLIQVACAMQKPWTLWTWTYKDILRRSGHQSCRKGNLSVAILACKTALRHF